MPAGRWWRSLPGAAGVVGVARGGAQLAMAEHRADLVGRDAGVGQSRGEAVPQIVDAQRHRQPRLLLRPHLRATDVLQPVIWAHPAGEDERIAPPPAGAAAAPGSPPRGATAECGAAFRFSTAAPSARRVRDRPDPTSPAALRSCEPRSPPAGQCGGGILAAIGVQSPHQGLGLRGVEVDVAVPLAQHSRRSSRIPPLEQLPAQGEVEHAADCCEVAIDRRGR